MVLEIPIGSVVVIENQTTGQFITVSIAGAAESDMQLVAVGLPAGYQIRIESAGCTASDSEFLPAPINLTRSIKSTSHQTANAVSQRQLT